MKITRQARGRLLQMIGPPSLKEYPLAHGGSLFVDPETSQVLAEFSKPDLDAFRLKSNARSIKAGESMGDLARSLSDSDPKPRRFAARYRHDGATYGLIFEAGDGADAEAKCDALNMTLDGQLG